MSAIPNLPGDVPAAAAPDGVSGDWERRDLPATNGDRTSARNGPTPTNSTNTTAYSLSDHHVENFRKMRVIVVGAGYSGIYLGIRLPERIRNLELVIYEKNDGVGGTWWENRYPGCACDIPSHSYQYSFSPNREWSAVYAPQSEIQAYLENTACKYGADRFIKLSHRVTACDWDERAGKWRVKVQRQRRKPSRDDSIKEQSGEETNGEPKPDAESGEADADEEFEDEADVLITARGNLNEMSWPDIQGLEDFKGAVIHSAKWDESFDFANKRIGVIGSGSSAIQIVPSLQRLPGTHISSFVRSRTWISPTFGQQLWDEMGMKWHQFPDETIKRFRDDATAYQEFRLAVETSGNAIHGATIKSHPIQVAGQAAFEEHMRSRLSSRPDIFESLLPSFAPGCRRLTPGPGFLEALTEPNVDFINTAISRIDANGVQLQDGRAVPLDALVCATGFNVGAPPPFPVRGRRGTPLSERWSVRPKSYLSVAVDGFPNLFFMFGPNAAIGSGSLTVMIEAMGDYIVKCVRKLQKENVRDMEVRLPRVDDFIEYVDNYFAGTVFTDDCRSWYKKDGKVVGLWPGSTLHCMEALRSPRWEDFSYRYIGDEEDREEELEERRAKRRKGNVNRMAWLGNGWSVNQLEERDLAWYLYPEFMDVPNAKRPEENERLRIRPFSH